MLYWADKCKHKFYKRANSNFSLNRLAMFDTNLKNKFVLASNFLRKCLSEPRLRAIDSVLLARSFKHGTLIQTWQKVNL